MGRASSLIRLETLQDTGMPDPTREMRYILDLTRPYNNLLATEGAQNQSFVWGNELLMAEGEKPFGYLQDHLGSPIRLIMKANRTSTHLVPAIFPALSRMSWGMRCHTTSFRGSGMWKRFCIWLTRGIIEKTKKS